MAYQIQDCGDVSPGAERLADQPGEHKNCA
jgi:hypothetical protein